MILGEGAAKKVARGGRLCKVATTIERFSSRYSLPLVGRSGRRVLRKFWRSHLIVVGLGTEVL